MNNLRLPNSTLFCVIEQVDEVMARTGGSMTNPNDIELVDLRVAFLSPSGREDESSLVEMFIDSRRVQLWNGNAA